MKPERDPNERLSIFDKPPDGFTSDDGIRDYWNCKDNEKCKIDYRPRIGVLTQPVGKGKRSIFDYDQYILEINNNFVKWAGSIPFAVPYDITQEKLDKLLP